ncbi:signal recognition particle-docking protein FtsY [Bdellovibrio sp. HCB2-146]|uniref:signal recognition particle-docking protein FtsY n=1 Tax=Bdellovibrio sp. HCB2-146 TaxID=3394362 RepID=UPI0039BD2118
MSPGHAQQMDILLILIGVLLLVILGVIFASVLKKKKPAVKAEEAKALESKEPTSFIPTEKHKLPTEAPAVPVEKEEVPVELKEALRKTEENLFGRIRALFKSEGTNSNLDEIEEILYTSDLGPTTVQRLMGALEDKLPKKERGNYEIVRDTLKEEIKNIFVASHSAMPTEGILSKIQFASEGPTVLMIVGVNGAGKTTSIGKISAQLAQQGKKVLVAAGDTFRAAAGGQLKVWTDRAQVEIFSPEGVTDPSAVAFDAVAKGKAQHYDVVIVDTAGRLHTQANLMEEIKKMKRVMTKVIPEAPHETLIVLDANSGQNALMQAKEFHTALGLTGAILTKMDGTAKGGVAVGLAQELQIPIKLIGVGERIQDLRTFSAQEFVDSLFVG